MQYSRHHLTVRLKELQRRAREMIQMRWCIYVCVWTTALSLQEPLNRPRSLVG